MQSTPTRVRGNFWLRWGRVLLLGVALGLLQFLLLHEADAIGQWSNSNLTALGLGVLLYVLLPGLEGFFTVQRKRVRFSPGSVGVVVGVISLLALGICITIQAVQMPPPPACVPGETCGRYPVVVVTGPSIAFALLLVSFVVIICCLIGGWLGGQVGAWLAPMLNTGSATAAEHTP